MIRNKKNFFGAALGMAFMTMAMSSANAQFFDGCFDPNNTDPLSQDANSTRFIDLSGAGGMFSVLVGLTGSYDFGPAPPCPPPLVGSHDIPGAIGFVSINGSFLSGSDDVCALTDAVSANVNQTPPLPPADFVGSNKLGYASIRVVDADGNTTDTKWGEDGFTEVIAPGASNRYLSITDVVEGDVQAKCVFRDLGPTIRMEWTLTNVGADTVQAGLRFAQWVRMKGDPLTVPITYIPTERPSLLQHMWVRANDPNFPDYVDFVYNQADPFPALRFLMTPNDGHLDQTKVDRFEMATPGSIDGGNIWDAPITEDVFHGTAAVFWWDPISLDPGESRTIVFYAEPSSVHVDTREPYSLATEADQVLKFSPGGQNFLDPNPFVVYGYVNNQYGRINSQVDLQNVQMTITLPPGLTLAGGEQATKTIDSVPPNEFGVVSWNVVSDGTHVGILPYSIEANPGFPVSAPTRTISGSTTIALTPKVDFAAGPNLVTFPWDFNDPSFNAIGLGGGTAYDWDADAQAYVVANQAERGVGQWVVFNGDPAPFTLTGANEHDIFTPFTQTLQRGWNLIGNPHPYPIPLNQLIGLNSTLPGQTFTWEQMSDQNWIRGPLWRFDTSAGGYVFDSNVNQVLLAGQGYWVYVNTVNPIDIVWPIVFMGGATLMQHTDPVVHNGWMVPISVSGISLRGTDRMNAFGMSQSTQEAEKASAKEAPAMPGGNLRLAFTGHTGDSNALYAYDIRKSGQVQTFHAQVTTVKSGTYTLTWKMPRAVPQGATVIIRDLQTGSFKNMKNSSSMSFTMSQPGVRRFDITVVNR
jgi:hypothetical protein